MFEDTVREYRKYGFIEAIYDELDDFHKAKESYLENGRTPELYGEMAMKYDIIYTSTKHQWVGRKISEQTFRDLTAMLQEGLRK